MHKKHRVDGNSKKVRRNTNITNRNRGVETMRKVNQYPFKLEYNKTFIDGHLKGMTVRGFLGSCDSARIEDNRKCTDYVTGATYIITDCKVTKNYF